MKYPEYRDEFKDARWFRGHLCFRDGYYYKLVRVDGEKEKQLMKFTYDELQDRDKEIIVQVEEEERESAAWRTYYHETLLPAREKLIAYVRENGRLSNTSQWGSEYWVVKSPVNGINYGVRISGHVNPAGSQTRMPYNSIDTTDEDCREFLKLFNL